MTTLDTLRAQVERLDARIALLEAFGEDVYDNGAVFTFNKRFSSYSKSYTYAAVKAAGMWYLTGSSTQPHSWAQLVEFLSEGVEAVYFCDSAEQIYP